MVADYGAKGQRLHVAVLAFPFGTHAAPLHALAAGLAAAAPHVTFSFLNSAKSNAALTAAFSSPSNLNYYDIDDGAEANYIAGPEEEVELFMRVTPGNFEEGIDEAVRRTDGAKITCVLSDCFLWFAGELASKAGVKVPWIGLSTGGPRSLSTHLYTDLLRDRFNAGEAKPEDELDFLPGMMGTRYTDLPEGIISGDLSSAFARLLHQMGLHLPSAAAVVINTFEGFDPSLLKDFQAKFKKSLPLGPLNLLLPPPPRPDTTGCLEWLDQQLLGNVAYIAFGTMLIPPPAELADLAEGLETSGAHFIWSLKRKFWEFLPAGFLCRTASRGLVLEWTPQAQVLMHPAVGAFVTHCGWNSVMESVAGGVPMICRPFLGDQQMNERCISHVWKIGVGFPNGRITKDKAAEALHIILGTVEGKEMKQRASELSAVAHRQVQPGGSSSENLRIMIEMVSDL